MPTSLAALWWVYWHRDFTPQSHLPPFLQQKLQDFQLRQFQGVMDKCLNSGKRQETAGRPAPPRPGAWVLTPASPAIPDPTATLRLWTGRLQNALL